MFTGCAHNITKEVEKVQKEVEKVAKDFLAIRGYECPREYSIYYLDKNKDKLCIESDKSEVVFNISEGELEMVSIKYKNYNISQNQIDEIRDIGDKFIVLSIVFFIFISITEM